MKVSYLSDIHADHHVPFNYNQLKWEKRTKAFITALIETDVGKKEVLVIAGDLSHFNVQSKWVLETCSLFYEQVLLVSGNHDHYLVSKNQSAKYRNNHLNRVHELREIIKFMKNVELLEDFAKFVYQDVTFSGSTFWYPLEDIDQQLFFRNVSNDSRFIKGASVQSIHERHLFEMSEYERLDWVDVIVTHVPPIIIDAHRKYQSTACYLSPIKALKANAYIFGHCHEQNVYEKVGSKFYINAMGYPSERLELGIRSFEV